MKLIVCGSREWRNVSLIREWMSRLPKGTIVVHGGARGADTIAGDEARALGFEVRAYPVDNAIDGPWPAAGVRRNARMLASEPDVDAVFAFSWVVAPADRTAPKSITRGTSDMVTRALEAGIRVTIIPPPAHTPPA
jgi:hypothetical protein